MSTDGLQAEMERRKAATKRLQLQGERREIEATWKRLAEKEAELDERAAKQQRQIGHTNSENSTSNYQLTVLTVLRAQSPLGPLSALEWAFLPAVTEPLD